MLIELLEKNRECSRPGRAGAEVVRSLPTCCWRWIGCCGNFSGRGIRNNHLPKIASTQSSAQGQRVTEISKIRANAVVVRFPDPLAAGSGSMNLTNAGANQQVMLSLCLLPCQNTNPTISDSLQFLSDTSPIISCLVTLTLLQCKVALVSSSLPELSSVPEDVVIVMMN